MSKAMPSFGGMISKAESTIPTPDTPPAATVVLPRRQPKPSAPVRVPLNVTIDPAIRDGLNKMAYELNTPIRELVEDVLRQLVASHQ